MDQRLAGKRAIVTGAGSGIGRATALRLAAEGAAVALVDIEPTSIGALADELRAAGHVAFAFEADVSKEESVQAAIDAAALDLGGIDSVVANAGVELTGQDAAVHELELATWRRTLDINLTGCFLTNKYAVRHLLDGGGGSVVITGSPDGMFGIALGAHAYSASKGGCHGLARIMAAEYAPRRIRVNVVVPGWIDTPINAALLASDAGIEDDIARIPLRRMGTPEEVAGLVAYLLSDEAAYATGGFYHLDGGLTAI